jgi:hypothetical protein
MTSVSEGTIRSLRRPGTGAWPGRASALLCLLVTAALAGCSSPSIPPIEQLVNGTPPPGEPRLSTGLVTIGHPVDDLDLEAMVPPGGTWVTNGVLDGVGPYSFTPSLAPVRGRPGEVHVAFLCLDNPGSSIGADYDWFGQTSVLFCDSGPQTRSVFTFDLDNSAKTVLPQIELPAGATWQLIAWLAPPSHQPAVGTSAGGN